MRKTTAIASAAVAVATLAAGGALAAEFRLSAFGDFTFGITSDTPANAAAAAMYAQDGVSTFPVNRNEGFGVVGTDFVLIADVNDEMTYLAEINIQTERGESGEVEVDPERFFMNYRVNDAFNLQPGLFFTPVGYHNRFQYSRAWLMHSIQVPDLFEEDYNLVPTHMIGLSVHGDIFVGGNHRLNYAVAAGNGRASTPNEAVYARDNNRAKEITGLLEWNLPVFRDTRIAVSGWVGKVDSRYIDSLGGSGDDSLPAMELLETGFNPYFTLKTRRFDLVGEYVWARTGDELGNLPQDHYDLHGLFAEVALHFRDQTLHPFLRFDRTVLPEGNGGPFYGLRSDGGEFTRGYVPEANAIFAGAAFDLNPNARLKVEFSHNFDGPRGENALATQFAFGF